MDVRNRVESEVSRSKVMDDTVVSKKKTETGKAEENIPENTNTT